MEELLVGYLYGELSAEERERVEREIARDPEWERTLEEMRGVSGLLRRMDEPEMDVRFAWTALPERRRSGRTLPSSPRWYRRRSFWGVAAGLAAAVLLILGNARVSFEEGRVAFSLGHGGPATVFDAPDQGVPLQLVSGNPAGAPSGDYITREDFLRGQAELVRFVATLIQESEDRQADRFLTAFRDYVEDVELERHGEMLLMDQRLGDVEENARNIRHEMGTEPDQSQEGPRGENQR